MVRKMKSVRIFTDSPQITSKKWHCLGIEILNSFLEHFNKLIRDIIQPNVFHYNWELSSISTILEPVPKNFLNFFLCVVLWPQKILLIIRNELKFTDFH